MDIIATLGRTLGFSFAAGLNLYATVAILGLAARYDWVALPPQFEVFDDNLVIGVALAMYVIEFCADKIPWVDTACISSQRQLPLQGSPSSPVDAS